MGGRWEARKTCQEGKTCRISRWAPGIFVEQKTSKSAEESMASRVVGIRLETKSHDAGL